MEKLFGTLLELHRPKSGRIRIVSDCNLLLIFDALIEICHIDSML